MQNYVISKKKMLSIKKVIDEEKKTENKDELMNLEKELEHNLLQ